jgi:predicted transcriptional regulator
MIKMSCEIKVVESISRYNREINEKIAKGILDKPERGIVMSPETFSKVFSPERIKLLQRIYRNNVKSIYQLAKDLNKPYEVVFRNIKYLAGIGLIEIKEKDNRKIPHISCKLSIDMLNSESIEA